MLFRCSLGHAFNDPPRQRRGEVEVPQEELGSTRTMARVHNVASLFR